MGLDRRRLYDRAQQQRGLLTRRDLHDLAVSRHHLEVLRRTGALIPLGTRVFAVGGMALDDRARLLACCLDVAAAASHLASAWLHPWPTFGPAGPEVMKLGSKASYRTELGLVHTTTNLGPDDLTVVDGIPCTSVARTIFSLAGTVPAIPLERVREAVDDAVRLGFASDAWLWWRLEKLRCSGRNGVSVLEEILTDRAQGGPTESWLERAYLRLSADADLPAPACQRRIRARGAFVARVDFLYEAERIVIEVTGAVGHSSPEQRAADAHRRNELITAGYLVLEFTYEQVVHHPGEVIAQVEQALRTRWLTRRP